MIRNTFTLIGRLTADPRTTENKDSSKRVQITIAVGRGYKGADGKEVTDFIDCEARINQGIDYNKTPYSFLNKGDLCIVNCSMRSYNYTTTDGQMKYGQKLQINELRSIESKATKQARLNKCTKPA